MPLHELYQMSKQNLDHKDISNSHTLPSSSTIVNFSHFAKPVAIVKANLQNIGLSSSRSESVGVRNKDEAVTVSNPCKLTKVDLSGECLKKSVISCHQAVDPSTVDLKYSEAKYPEQEADVSRPACKEDVSKVDRTSNQVLGESGRNGQEDVVKCMEPAEVSSSVCSENGAYRGSDDPNQNLKGKNIYSEDSEDDDNESVGIKRMARGRGGFGSKRNRSAEVHNLSERRRRDTINEKMRTLQELIPNCNKTDNASMLDEAIKYLKTLQLQLQIMSMAGGALYRPLMLPAGMQHMLMSPFSAMSVSMKMGLGVPQFQGTHLPVANPQMFGLPGQGLMPMPCAPMFSYPRESAINSLAVGLNANGTAGFMETVGLASKLKDPMPNVNSQVMQNNNDHNSANPMSIQCEPTIGGAEQSNLVLNTGRVSSTDYTLGNEDSPVIDKSNE